MAEWLSLIEIGRTITQCLWPAIKTHFNYWWCFDNNIQVLKDGVGDLESKIYDMNRKIEGARLRTDILRPEVEEWSETATKKLKEAKGILTDDINPKAWNLISRYSIGKRAKKAAEEIAKHLNDGNKFNVVADPAPPASMGYTPHGSSTDFVSRKRIEEDIIKSLKKSSVSMIGICGMGGVGKTTMAQRIRDRVMEEKLFEEVVMVVVSQRIDMLQKEVSKLQSLEKGVSELLRLQKEVDAELLRLQKEVAELLRLPFDGVESMPARADKLRKRLMDTKSILIIFDDVWGRLELKDLGVPFESGIENCKILLTTRSKDVCEEMEAQEIIPIKILTDEEAWNLFKEKAGERVEDSVLHGVAKQVVAECKGLPIALVTVGKALQNKQIEAWRYSLSQLRQANPDYFPEVLKYVYKPLKLSYDHLDNKREQLLFLLCCLFPEDYNIPVEELTLYFIGLRIFENITSIEEIRDGINYLVEKLKSRFLLIDGRFDGRFDSYVKMHDVVRDVAIYICSKEKDFLVKSLNKISTENSSDINCNWMSVDVSNEPMNVDMGLRFPELRLLMLLNLSSDISLKGIRDLNVLSFRSISIGSLPPMPASVQNLRTLYLDHCAVEDISVIGELAALEILSCEYCDEIKELPAEIGTLNRLRLLKLIRCRKLRSILLSLVRSEELKKLVKTKDCKSGIVFPLLERLELEDLDNIEEIWDGTIIPNQNVSSLCNLKYLIIYKCSKLRYLFSVSGATTCLLQLEVLDIVYCEAMEQVFRNDVTDGCIDFPKLKELKLDNLPNLAAFSQGLQTIKFPNLTQMWIGYLPKLISFCPLNSETGNHYTNYFHFLCNPKVEIGCLKTLTVWNFDYNNNMNIWCHQNPINFFNNLQDLRIRCIHGIRSLMSYSITKKFVSLKYLTVGNCDKIVEVIEGNDDDKEIVDIKSLFPILKTLVFHYLPKLRRFWQWNHALELPLLEEVIITNCPVMETFTFGSLNTPNLRRLNINFQEIDDVKDLNAIPHHYFND